MSEITWGDSVRISEDAPAEFRPGEFASVCGMHEFPEEGLKYLVEFSDGSAIEVNAQYVQSVDAPELKLIVPTAE